MGLTFPKLYISQGLIPTLLWLSADGNSAPRQEPSLAARGAVAGFTSVFETHTLFKARMYFTAFGSALIAAYDQDCIRRKERQG